MTQLATRDIVPAITHDAPMSADLRHAVADLVSPTQAIRHATSWPHALSQEAQRLLPEQNHVCRPSTRELIAAWLAPVAAGVANPPQGRDMAARIALVCEASGDLPAAVWTSATRTLGVRQWRFFPSAAEVDELLRPLGEEMRSTRDALQKIADRPHGTVIEREPRHAPTCDEIAAVTALLSAHRNAKAAAVVASAPVPVKALHLSNNQIAADIRNRIADGTANELDRTRLAMLERNATKETVE